MIASSLRQQSTAASRRRVRMSVPSEWRRTDGITCSRGTEKGPRRPPRLGCGREWASPVLRASNRSWPARAAGQRSPSPTTAFAARASRARSRHPGRSPTSARGRSSSRSPERPRGEAPAGDGREAAPQVAHRWSIDRVPEAAEIVAEAAERGGGAQHRPPPVAPAGRSDRARRRRGDDRQRDGAPLHRERGGGRRLRHL